MAKRKAQTVDGLKKLLRASERRTKIVREECEKEISKLKNRTMVLELEIQWKGSMLVGKQQKINQLRAAIQNAFDLAQDRTNG